MTTTITLPNRKGGVAKTTSTVNLAAEFHARGLRVLTVDCDPQSTLTMVAGESLDELAAEETLLAAMLPERFDGAFGSSSKLRQCTSTWSACSKRASADSNRRLPM